MLVVLTGPSGCGKTTTIRAGCEIDGWFMIETFTTRPARPDFDSKTQITRAESRKLERRSADYLVTEYDHNLYVNRLRDLEHAAHTGIAETYVVDWVHEYPTSLTAFGPYAVGIILCPSRKILRTRLASAGRLDRLESSTNDYAKIHRDSPSYPRNWVVIRTTRRPLSMAGYISEIASKIYSLK